MIFGNAYLLALLAFDLSLTEVKSENYWRRSAQTSRRHPHGFGKDPHSQFALAARKCKSLLVVARGLILVILLSYQFC